MTPRWARRGFLWIEDRSWSLTLALCVVVIMVSLAIAASGR